jgi:hypothetical protein
MFIMWLILFELALLRAYKSKDWRLVLLALVCVPFLIYFTWAMTGLWSTHIVALAFNRTAQLSSMFVLVLLIFGISTYER